MLLKNFIWFTGERLYGNVVVNADQHRDEVDNFEIVLDSARSNASCNAAGPSGTPGTSASAGQSSVAAGQSGLSAAGAAGSDVVAAASGSASESVGGPSQDSATALGQCVATQSSQVDQSATPLIPPMVSMATAHYSTLEEEDLPGNLFFFS